jgi:hypothetical protein
MACLVRLRIYAATAGLEASLTSDIGRRNADSMSMILFVTRADAMHGRLASVVRGRGFNPRRARVESLTSGVDGPSRGYLVVRAPVLSAFDRTRVELATYQPDTLPILGHFRLYASLRFLGAGSLRSMSHCSAESPDRVSFVRRLRPNARKLCRRLIRPMRRACMPLGELFSRVYEVSMVEVSHITASHRRCRDDRRQILAYCVHTSVIRLTRFLVIYRFLRDLPDAQMGEKFSFSTLWRVHLQSL